MKKNLSNSYKIKSNYIYYYNRYYELDRSFFDMRIVLDEYCYY